MKLRFLFLIFFTSFGANHAVAELYVLGWSQHDGWSPVIARSPEEALELRKSIAYNTTESGYPTRVVQSCKAGGWWATIMTFGGGKGGACNHSSRVAAKQAAIKSCREKAGCNLDKGELLSGFDDTSFDATRNARNIRNTGNSYVWPPMSPKWEYCESTQNDEKVWKCYRRMTSDELVRGSSSYTGQKAVNIDIQRIAPSPWDKE